MFGMIIRFSLLLFEVKRYNRIGQDLTFNQYLEFYNLKNTLTKNQYMKQIYQKKKKT